MADVNKIVSGTRVKNFARTVLNNGGKLSTSVNPDRKEVDLYSRTILGQIPKAESINLLVRPVGQSAGSGDGGQFVIPNNLNGFTLFKVTATFYTPIGESGQTTVVVQKKTLTGDTTLGTFEIVDNQSSGYSTFSTSVAAGNSIVVYLDGMISEPAPDGLSFLLEFRK